jgi:hypothetical protein
MPRLALLALLASACTPRVYSPPARTLPLETPATLEPGAYGFDAEGGYSGAVFGPELATAALRVRRGLDEGIEAAAELGFVHVDRGGDTDTHPNGYLVRAGIKLQPEQAFALRAGVGGGGSAAGGFVSPDIGITLAFENAYFVPFVSGDAWVSQPIAASEIHLGTDDDGDDVWDRPKPSFGLRGTGGFRVPWNRERPAADSFAFGLSLAHLADEDDDIGLFGISAGVQLHL